MGASACGGNHRFGRKPPAESFALPQPPLAASKYVAASLGRHAWRLLLHGSRGESVPRQGDWPVRPVAASRAPRGRQLARLPGVVTDDECFLVHPQHPVAAKPFLRRVGKMHCRCRAERGNREQMTGVAHTRRSGPAALEITTAGTGVPPDTRHPISCTATANARKCSQESRDRRAANRSARNLPEFLRIPLGFVVRRPYDGGLLIFGVDADLRRNQNLTEVCASTCRAERSASRAGGLEENENNLRDTLDTSLMCLHNRQFSTEGCPSG